MCYYNCKVRSSLSSSTCEEVEPYLGSTCRDVLTSLQTCFSGASPSPPPLNIPSAIDQQQVEMDVTQLLTGLELFLNPTPECSEEILPFLCLHAFGLCDTGGNHHTVPREDCIRLRDDICSSEFSAALSLLPPGSLPVCEDLLDETKECTGWIL